MFKFLHSFRAALLLGKANKLFDNGHYRETLERALKAQKLESNAQLQWLAHALEGKSRFHLGDSAGALPALQQAQSLLAAIAAGKGESKSLQNIIADIQTYIEKCTNTQNQV